MGEKERCLMLPASPIEFFHENREVPETSSESESSEEERGVFHGVPDGMVFEGQG